jgi:hypothetical protein
VTRLSKAGSTPARSKATLAIMRALHIPVVTASGKPVVVSPEPNAARRFALYDFELRGLGDAVARGPVTDLSGVSADLTRAGLTLDGRGKPFPTQLLRVSLLGAVKQAVHRPRAGRSLLPLIVRQLGLLERPRYDLAGRKVPKAIPLDGLQAWLITADIKISVLRHLSAGASASTAARPPRPGARGPSPVEPARTARPPRADLLPWRRLRTADQGIRRALQEDRQGARRQDPEVD